MGAFTIEIGMKLLLVLPFMVSLAIAVPVEILSYSAAEEKHDHEMEGVPGEAVMGEFSFQAPDTGDAVYRLTYTADMDGFQAMGDHLPVPVIMDPVPEAALPEMVDYTPEVAAARAEFLRAQEAIMAEHAAMENMVDDEAVEAEAEVEEMRRKRREAEPVVIPTHANVLPATTYHHLAGAYPVYYNNPYLTYPLHQVRAPIVSQPVYSYPIYRVLPQVATDVSATIEEGDDEPAALAL